MTPERAGRLIVVSGPSGVGKSTVLRRVVERSPVPLARSVSATTRAARPGEIDGVDYYFWDAEQFEKHRAAGDFLECFQVFGRGDWYGTPRSEVEPRLSAGQWVLLEIDVQGARRIVEAYPATVTIFLRTESIEELERRLRGRNTETESRIQQRLERARAEMAAAGRYDYQIINDDVDRAVREVCDVLTQVEKNQHA
ncbi:MAG TPA: guanylate kinase [Thermoguttaceae bacterium]|nr:guanylate kinase [Thermoguttaceae bacterium]